jgi:type II secretory pathway pseudopilin PulG
MTTPDPKDHAVDPQDIAEPEHAVTGGGSRWFWRILIAVVLFAFAAAIVIPNYVRARETGCQNSCINNLRQIDGAKQQLALEQRKPEGAAVTWQDLSPYLGRTGNDGNTHTLECPGKGTYTLGPIGADPTCSMPDHTLAPGSSSRP